MKGGLVWIVFALGVAIAAGVMIWASVMLTDLETAQAEATRRTLADQNVRAALWQLESELTPLITDEATRPYFHYASFYPAEGAYTRMFGDLRPDEPLLPSPLLGAEPGKVQLYFQYEPDGELTSPQAPAGEKERLALRYLNAKDVQAARDRLRSLGQSVSRTQLLAQLPSRQYGLGETPPLEMVYADEKWASQAGENAPNYQQRADATKKAAQDRIVQTNSQLMQQAPGALAVNIREGPMTALWHGEMLLLARRIKLDERDYVQGCLLDWSAIRGGLVTASRELLPNADFRPAPLDPSRIEAAHVQRLAALPIEVLPGDVPVNAPGGLSPLRATLYVAWACMALVAGSLAFVLRRTLALSARREEFVSAVTHELRTPLTTFRMYTEMLQSGRVKDEAARSDYYNTLHNEALRLGHLVENVLAYARLERGRRQDRIEQISLSRLMERATERLAQRTVQAGVELDVSPSAAIEVEADPGAVEQILFNLVDNACKYAPGSRLAISSDVADTEVHIRVRDHGPGISRADAAKLFQPFRKSAQQAANSAPGVGLGLALSRRLARAMGGELALESGVRDGCSFLLTLPRK
jgi:signal transduction histidine kinase